MKKVLSFVLIMVMCVGMMLPVNAVDVASNEQLQEEICNLDVATTVYNEGMAYVELKATPDSKLKAAGYSDEEIQEIRAFSMEDALLERAKLPTETLRAYGYTEEQIVLLREYDGSPLTLNSAVLAATSDCDGVYDIGNASTSSISFTYTWTWNIVPLNKMTDTVVVAWEGVRLSNNGYMDLTPSTNVMYIHYYEMMSGERAVDQDTSVNGVHVTNKNYASYSVDMAIDDNYYWAKEGVVYLTLYPDNSSATSDTAINYIDLGAGYGHQQVSVEYSFSVSETLSVSFTPVLIVNKINDASVFGRVYSDGRCVNEGPEET